MLIPDSTIPRKRTSHDFLVSKSSTSSSRVTSTTFTLSTRFSIFRRYYHEMASVLDWIGRRISWSTQCVARALSNTMLGRYRNTLEGCKNFFDEPSILISNAILEIFAVYNRCKHYISRFTSAVGPGILGRVSVRSRCVGYSTLCYVAVVGWTDIAGTGWKMNFGRSRRGRRTDGECLWSGRRRSA